MKKAFFILFASVLLFPVAAFSQITAPSPIRDTSKRADTTRKPVFTLKTLGIAPLYVFEMNDNAKINAAHQFPGARALPDSCYYPGERHLKNIRQLTFEGKNTRPSISPDDHYLAFQAIGVKPNSCDQIYRMPLEVGIPASRISSGKGQTRGVAFLSANEIVYGSTEALYGGACPPNSTSGSDLYISDTNGKQVRWLTNDSAHFNGYPTVAPNGDRILFTSDRQGDVQHLFSIKPDGSDVRQLSHEDGFNESVSYSPDGKKIVCCVSNPEEQAIYVMNADGSHARRVIRLDGIISAPCWTPDGEHIIFARDHLESHNSTDLFIVKSDGTGLERITDGGGFNGYPTFTRDGKHLVFCSGRNATHPNDVNIFVADWVQ